MVMCRTSCPCACHWMHHLQGTQHRVKEVFELDLPDTTRRYMRPSVFHDLHSRSWLTKYVGNFTRCRGQVHDCTTLHVTVGWGATKIISAHATRGSTRGLSIIHSFTPSRKGTRKQVSLISIALSLQLPNVVATASYM